MNLWLEQLSDYIEKKSPVSEETLFEEFQETAEQTDLLLEASEQMEEIYVKIREQLEHVSR